MPNTYLTAGAIIGSTLMALSLAGSFGTPARSHDTAGISAASRAGFLAEAERLNTLARAAFAAGRYADARQSDLQAVDAALKARSARKAAMYRNNAGAASGAAMQYRTALEDLTCARDMAIASGEMVPLLYALNNLAGLYLQMGVPETALRISQDALSGPASHAEAAMHAKLLLQKGQALAQLHRFDEGEVVYRRAIDQFMDLGDLDGAALGWGNLGTVCLDAKRYSEAEWALSESLRLVRTHRLRTSAGIMTSLGILRSRQGNPAAAETLFQNALDAHESLTPTWVIYLHRGYERVESGNAAGGLADFREARRLALLMRAEVVPVDRDRIGVESRVNRAFLGLVAAGNQLAFASGDRALIAETFDAAEQDRLWSLRALVPTPNDWRRRVPARYWELLSRFQSAERSLMSQPSPALEKAAGGLNIQLQEMEAHAGESATRRAAELSNVQANLDSDSVLLSFSVNEAGSWLWAVDRRHARVFPLPPPDRIQHLASDFTQAVQHGADSTAPGRELYTTLFGALPPAMLHHSHWLLEPDGPLYGVPFAALPTGDSRLLVEQAELQIVPGAPTTRRGAIPAGGSFLGVGDPVFNAADARAHGRETPPGIQLARLPNSANEVQACARAWGSGTTQLLTGESASLDKVETALASSPAVIHFATHVVSAPGESGSGAIALGLDARGGVGVMNPVDIVAHPVPGSLVVVNGCHSGQGKALPGSGLMGLTRAWLGAGAGAVIATQWNVPDDSAQSLMVNFYAALRGVAAGSPSRALREAQLTALHSRGPDSQPVRWAAYFLMSRI